MEGGGGQPMLGGVLEGFATPGLLSGLSDEAPKD